MHIKRKRGQLYWIMRDAAVPRRATIQIDLEYDILDRSFTAGTRQRHTPLDHWSSWRTASRDELEIAKARLSPQELAECLAESINPSVWARASRAARHLTRRPQ